MRCEHKNCKYYSDCDVYYEDGTNERLCSHHAMLADPWVGENKPEPKKVIQVVPQHGGDMNQLLPGYEFNGKVVDAVFQCKVTGPLKDHKGDVVGYHVDIKVSKNQPIIHTTIGKDQILVPGTEIK